MRVLIVRIGALGDSLITTPLIRQLKQDGNEVYYLGSDQAQVILKNNPNIDKFIHHKHDSIPNNKLGEYFESIKQAYECDKMIDLCESIEVKLALIPEDPKYNLPKYERAKLCNKNYYDQTLEIAGCKTNNKLPEMFFSQEEEDEFAEFREENLGFKVIVWGLSGSGRNKSYPYVPYIVADLLKKYRKLKIVFVGDMPCQILECGMPEDKRVIKKSGKWSFRQSALACKYADLVVSPDTGLLHAAGCFDTPKIGLLGHSTIENITKYFINDYSLEAECDCAPCFRLIKDANIQCPTDKISSATWCMSKGLPAERVKERIEEVLYAN